jgi:beta-mannosidase
MGTLIWQFNDAWPAISWSSIDYFGRWKPLQYKMKKLYSNIISFYQHSKGKIYAINDNLYELNTYVEYRIIFFNGTEVKR